MNGDDEVWRPIPGWERLYEVSSLGNVRAGKARGHGRTPGYPLRPVRGSVGLCRDGVKQSIAISRLVALAFPEAAQTRPARRVEDERPLTPGELWRDVPGYEGLYEVSSLGRFRRGPERRRGSTPWWPVPIVNGKVRLTRDGKQRGFSAKRLAAKAWDPLVGGAQVLQHDDAVLRQAVELVVGAQQQALRQAAGEGEFPPGGTPTALLYAGGLTFDADAVRQIAEGDGLEEVDVDVGAAPDRAAVHSGLAPAGSAAPPGDNAGFVSPAELERMRAEHDREPAAPAEAFEKSWTDDELAEMGGHMIATFGRGPFEDDHPRVRKAARLARDRGFPAAHPERFRHDRARAARILAEIGSEPAP